MINLWISIDFDSFAVWRMKGLEIFNYDKFKEFTKDFLYLGEKYETFIVSLNDDITKNDSNLDLYLEQLDLCYKATKQYYSFNIPLLNSSLNNDLHFIQKTIIWSYNSQGTISKYYVCFTDEILKNINPGLDLTEEERNSSYLADISPISIPTVSFNEKEGVDFSVYLHTNIFFPKVSATFKISKPFLIDSKYVDNSELSQLNASNFNVWFNELIMLVREYKGEIHLDTGGGIPKICKEFVNINGINILS
jgi:hypothetical protein